MSQRADADLIVVGAGPAGLMAGIAAARAGRRTLVLEQLPRPGAKLLASGGGRCNLTNTLPLERFQERFGRQGRFLGPALACLSPAALRQFLDACGIPTRVLDGFHVFPASERAQDVQAALLHQLQAAGGHLHLRTPVRDLLITGGAVCGVATAEGRFAAPQVILACGGCGYPDLGGGTGGLDLAHRAGHSLTPPVPALVPLLCEESWVGGCAGIALPEVEVRIRGCRDSRGRARGPLLFTHRGVSGPAVLDVSGAAAALLATGRPVTLELALFPDLPAAQWPARLDEWRLRHGAQGLPRLLDRHLPASLALAVAELAGAAGCRAADLPREAREQLLRLLAALPVTVRATEGFGRAMVTRGGVRLRDVDPDTLASRLLPGLAFAGELLDLDGPCGGFNLQWAFSSGWLAGSRAAAVQPLS